MIIKGVIPGQLFERMSVIEVGSLFALCYQLLSFFIVFELHLLLTYLTLVFQHFHVLDIITRV